MAKGLHHTEKGVHKTMYRLSKLTVGRGLGEFYSSTNWWGESAAFAMICPCIDHCNGYGLWCFLATVQCLTVVKEPIRYLESVGHEVVVCITFAQRYNSISCSTLIYFGIWV